MLKDICRGQKFIKDYPACNVFTLGLGSEVIKLFSCSTEHEISSAHKTKMLKK